MKTAGCGEDVRVHRHGDSREDQVDRSLTKKPYGHGRKRFWLIKHLSALGAFFFVFLSSTPKIGEMIRFDEQIFQMGWFNHQLGFDYRDFSKPTPSSGTLPCPVFGPIPGTHISRDWKMGVVLGYRRKLVNG